MSALSFWRRKPLSMAFLLHLSVQVDAPTRTLPTLAQLQTEICFPFTKEIFQAPLAISDFSGPPSETGLQTCSVTASHEGSVPAYIVNDFSYSYLCLKQAIQTTEGFHECIFYLLREFAGKRCFLNIIIMTGNMWPFAHEFLKNVSAIHTTYKHFNLFLSLK